MSTNRIPAGVVLGVACLMVVAAGSHAGPADTYEVSAADAVVGEGNGSSALQVTVTLSSTPDTFVLSATPVSSGTIELEWSYQRTDVEGYLVERVDGSTREHITTLPSTFGLFHHTGLVLGQSYAYQVSAYDGAQIVARSNIVTATPRSIPENVHYVSSAATGNHTGASWADAWTELPATLERGHTYFVADGTYPPYTFDDDQAGAEFIFIKKAVPDDHGASQGWSDDMGDGQAVFQHPSGNVASAFSICSGYLELDGQVGEGKAGHGFKMRIYEPNTEHNRNVVEVLDLTWSYTLLPYVNVRHCEMEHTGTDNTQSSGRGFQIHSQAGLENSLLQSCYIHDIPGISIYLTTTEGVVVEHCYCARNHSDPAFHGEGVQTTDAAHGVIIRFNTWEDIEGTAVIVTRSGWKIYGNVAFTTPSYPNPGQYGTSVSTFVFGQAKAGGIVSGVVIANNTIYGVPGTVSSGVRIVTEDTTGNQVLNNMWVENDRVRFSGFETMSHNYFCNNLNMPSADSLGDAVQIEDTCPLQDPAHESFELSTETDPGMELWHPFLYDRKGHRYGENGVWTRGAYEF
jgi:hypothetical protein